MPNWLSWVRSCSTVSLAKLTVEQLRTQLSQFGITPEQMFDQMNSTLERMKAQIEQPPSN